MWKDKSPGVKILWFWTIGTAAVLVANVATNRVREMNKLIKAQEESQQQEVTIIDDHADQIESVREDN